jgi:lipopolysaccharide transport system permease protein
MFLTPVAYPAEKLERAIPDGWEWILRMNPMYWVTEGFRWALLGTPTGPGWFIIWPILLVAILLISGAFVFRRTERTVVDLL